MGLNFKKSFKVAPGVRINTGKRGASVSVGGKGLTTNISKRGTRTTASIPGTGLSYTTKTSKKPANPKSERQKVPSDGTELDAPKKRSLIGTIFMWIGIITVGLFLLGLLAG